MIDHLDHLVLTVRDIERTKDFYVRGLGLAARTFDDGKQALLFGNQKFNLHPADGEPILPRAAQPISGSADFCLIADLALSEVIALLNERGIAVELGPVRRTGAKGAMMSVYLRDPDGNLVEISEYL